MKGITKLGQSLVDTLNQFTSSIGATGISGVRSSIGTASGRGNSLLGSGFFAGGEGGFRSGAKFTGKTPEQATNLFLSDFLSNATFEGISSKTSAILKRSLEENFGNIDKVVQDVNLAKIAFGDDSDQNKLKDALKAVNDQFGDLRARAIELGLPLENINKELEKQKNALLEPIFGNLQDFLDQQALSGESSLSASQRLSLARSTFDENLSNIRGGDLSGINEITSQASQLLGFGREVFASGEGFNALESFVRQSITGIGDQLGGEGSLENNIAREMTLSNAQQTSIMQQMLVELEELRKENKELRKSMERVGNSLNA